MPADTLRGLLIGAGHFSTIQLDAWHHVEGAQITGLVSRTYERAAAVAEAMGIGYVGTDVLKAIEALRPDFIDICTPPASHFEYARIAADYGLPVLCQKPIAPDLEESRALVEYCQRKKVRLMINENWRWQAWYQEIKRFIQAGQLGDIFHVAVVMRPGDGWGSSPYPDQPYFKDMPRFLLFETGIHYFDTLQFLFGKIERVYCHKRTINPLIKGEDYVIVVVDFSSGLSGVYDANRTSFVNPVRSNSYGWMHVEGSLGNLRLDLDGRLFITPRGGVEYEHNYSIPSTWKGGCAVAAQQHFVDALRSGAPFQTDGQDYLRTQELVEAAYRSASEGVAIRIDG